MNNSTKTNDAMFISEFTDISKWDLGGLNRITGFCEDETTKEASDNWNENGIFNCALPGWTSKTETTGIEDLEEIGEDNHLNICSSCGEEETPGFLDVVLQEVDGDFYCEDCIQKEIDRQNEYDRLYSEKRPEDQDGYSPY